MTVIIATVLFLFLKFTTLRTVYDMKYKIVFVIVIGSRASGETKLWLLFDSASSARGRNGPLHISGGLFSLSPIIINYLQFN